jgi:hypothetical protein
MHTIYYNSTGEEVPSVTTVLKILNKPQLVKWANILGLKGIKHDKELGTLAAIGEFVHLVIEADLLGGYTIFPVLKNPRTRAVINERIQYYAQWKENHTLKATFMEKSFSSNTYGGTVDFYGKLDNKRTVLDFKTGKSIYLSMFLQLAAYTKLMELQNYEIDQVGIVSFSVNGVVEMYKEIEEIYEYILYFDDLVRIFNKHNKFCLEEGWKNEIFR